MKKQTLAGVALVIALAALAGTGVLLGGAQRGKARTDAPPTSMEEHAMTADDAATEMTGAVSTPLFAPDSPIDVEKALAPRTLGRADAPVTVEEFASLTCGHCAHFQKETFPQFKAAYIDTGKVRYTYTDFPLNAPAVDAAMIARCLPADRYFKFIDFLFSTQEQWAFSSDDYKKNLKQNAKLVGATEKMLESCLDNQPLRAGLVERMQAAAKDHSIESTPTFLINGTEQIKGAYPFEAFQEKLDTLIEESHESE